MNQKEIITRRPLLDANGHPAHPGYAKTNLYEYNKEQIKRGRLRIKEWDFYLITDGRYKIELNFFNITELAALTASFTDFQTGETVSDAVIEPSGPDRFKLSPAADEPFVFRYKRLGRTARFETGENTHRLLFSRKVQGLKDFDVRIEGNRLPGQESLTMLTPFKKKGRFFYTQKLNCIAAKARVRIAGRSIYLDPERTFVTVDWGRGVWPYKNMWYWSNGSTVINGKRFGYELTWGFGDESNATETAVFYDGKCHKIGPVHLTEDPEKAGWMEPWHFISDDGRLDLTLTPEHKVRNGLIFAGVLGLKSNQVYGCVDGYAVLDDGTRLEIKDMFSFAEKVHNKW